MEWMVKEWEIVRPAARNVRWPKWLKEILAVGIYANWTIRFRYNNDFFCWVLGRETSFDFFRHLYLFIYLFIFYIHSKKYYVIMLKSVYTNLLFFFQGCKFTMECWTNLLYQLVVPICWTNMLYHLVGPTLLVCKGANLLWNVGPTCWYNKLNQRVVPTCWTNIPH